MKISVTRALTRIKTIGEQLENISFFKSPLVFTTLEKWKDTPQVKEKENHPNLSLISSMLFIRN